MNVPSKWNQTKQETNKKYQALRFFLHGFGCFLVLPGSGPTSSEVDPDPKCYLKVYFEIEVLNWNRLFYFFALVLKPKVSSSVHLRRQEWGRGEHHQSQLWWPIISLSQYLQKKVRYNFQQKEWSLHQRNFLRFFFWSKWNNYIKKRKKYLLSLQLMFADNSISVITCEGTTCHISIFCLYVRFPQRKCKKLPTLLFFHTMNPPPHSDNHIMCSTRWLVGRAVARSAPTRPRPGRSCSYSTGGFAPRPRSSARSTSATAPPPGSTGWQVAAWRLWS